MKKEELLYKLTGTEEPQFVNERENVIIDKCLEIINEKEQELQSAIDIINESQQPSQPQQYKSISYKTRNGIDMVRSTPYNWEKKENETIQGDTEYFFTISVGGLAERYYFLCDSSETQLTIAINDERLKFRISNLEEASKIVHSFVVGMDMEERMAETIYAKEFIDE